MKSEDIKIKKKIILTLIVLIFIIVLFAFKDSIRFLFLKSETILSYDETFEMYLTKGWEQTSKGKLNEDADIEIKNDSKDMYLIAIMDDIDGTSLTFQDYVDVIVYSMETGYKVTIPEVKSKGNYRYFDFEYNEGKEKIYMCIYIVKTDNYVGQITIWSSAENRDEVQKEIDNGIIGRIKERE